LEVVGSPEGTNWSWGQFLHYDQSGNHILGFFSSRLFCLQRVGDLPEPYPRSTRPASYRFDSSAPRHFSRGCSCSLGQQPPQVDPLSISSARVTRAVERPGARLISALVFHVVAIMLSAASAHWRSGCRWRFASCLGWIALMLGRELLNLHLNLVHIPTGSSAISASGAPRFSADRRLSRSTS